MVEPQSPAEAVGLRIGDRVVEINGVSVAQDTHRQVIERVRAVQGEANLLLVDPETYNYYVSKHVLITGSLPSVQICNCPGVNQYKDNGIFFFYNFKVTLAIH